MPLRIFPIQCFLLLAMSCYSCDGEKQLPIPDERLVQILSDIHIAESAIDVLTGTEKDSAAAMLYDQIYSIHQVDKADVDSCLSYLKRNPEKAEKIYIKVVEDLEQKRIEAK